MSARAALRKGLSAAIRYAPTEVTVYRVSYASADDPYDDTGQHTYTEHHIRGTFAPLDIGHEPIESQERLGGIVTINTRALGFVPSQADRMAIGTVVFNVTGVEEVLGEVAKCTLRGPTVAPQLASPGDITAPTVTLVGLLSGTGEFVYSVTFSEDSDWRIRYSFNLIGEITTEAYTGSYASATGPVTVSGLMPSTYGVEIQAKDEAGNETGWISLGSVGVS